MKFGHKGLASLFVVTFSFILISLLLYHYLSPENFDLIEASEISLSSCKNGLLLTHIKVRDNSMSEKRLLKIIPSPLKQRRDKLKNYVCVCPSQIYNGPSCAPTVPHYPNISLALAYPSWTWYYIPFNQFSPSESPSQEYTEYVERYLIIRNNGSALTPSCNFSSTPELIIGNKIDEFFLKMGMKHGPWQEKDANVLDKLLSFNQNLFFKKKINEKWFYENSETIQRGKILFVISFSKREAIDILKTMLKASYALDHYYIIASSMQIDSEIRSDLEEYIVDLWLNATNDYSHSNEKRRNIFITPLEYSVYGKRADITLVYMNILGILYAYEMGYNDWSITINLSESHFPIKPINSLTEFVTPMNQSQQFVECSYTTKLNRYAFIRLSLDQDMRTLNITHQFDENLIRLAGGSQWFAASNLFWRLVLSSKIGVETLIQSRYVEIPDELFVNTMAFTLLNPKLNQITLVDDRVIRKPYIVNESNNYGFLWLKWVHGIGSPIPITKELIPEILASKDKFFARKVTDINIANLILQSMNSTEN
jgi:hypothetical protein